MYSVYIKIDDSLPWIELDEEFHTKAEAKRAIKEKLGRAKIKISGIPKLEKQIKIRIAPRY